MKKTTPDVEQSNTLQGSKLTESMARRVSARERKPSGKFVDAVVSERTANRSDKETAALRSSFDVDIDACVSASLPTKKLSKRKQMETAFSQFEEDVNVRRSPHQYKYAKRNSQVGRGITLFK